MRRLVLAGLLVALPAAGWAQLPAGAEFIVNSYTTSFQGHPSVASDASGNFVVVWTSSDQDGSVYGVFGRRFNASGTPQGSEFRVNSYTTSYQTQPAVASAPNGDFVVVWRSDGQDGDSYGVFGRRFNAAGVPQGGDFQVNSYTTGRQYYPVVASDAAGNFIVVWSDAGQDGSLTGIFGQRFNAAGARLGSEFRINSYTTSFQSSPSLAGNADGSFVVVWQTTLQDGPGAGIFGKRFNAAGVPQSGDFRINSYTTGNQVTPWVAADAAGNFVAVWESGGQDGSSYGIFGQRFNASAVALGAEFRVNTYTTGIQNRARVASDEHGNFEVVWASNLQDGGGYGIFGQRFSSFGVAQGGEFRVNTFTNYSQYAPGVAANPDGDFLVVWETFFQDGDGSAVAGQRYGGMIFEDGFESGGLSRWSSASTDGGNLSVGAAAAMAGTTAGLQAFVNDTNSLFVQDDTPNAESRYRVRFYFDTNGYDPGEALSHFRTRIFIAFDDSGLRVATIVLKRQAGFYSVEARVRRNDGTRADTGFIPISDGPHFIELDWQGATGPGASNGSLDLWIDDAPFATLTGIDNDQNKVGFARLGALAIKTGAAGTLFFDQFESRRDRFIDAE